MSTEHEDYRVRLRDLSARPPRQDLPVFAQRKHPIDHAAVKAHMRIQRSSEALHQAHRSELPRPCSRCGGAAAPR